MSVNMGRCRGQVSSMLGLADHSDHLYCIPSTEGACLLTSKREGILSFLLLCGD